MAICFAVFSSAVDKNRVDGVEYGVGAHGFLYVAHHEFILPESVEGGTGAGGVGAELVA